jgi:hypothetical protein
MTLLRFADASTVWAIEIARIVLLIFGCAATGWLVGFAMGYREARPMGFPAAYPTPTIGLQETKPAPAV